MLDHALAIAARGWPVFPCSPRDKRPLTAKESAPGAKDGGLYLATCEIEQINMWWQRWPKAMIGVPTGARIGARLWACRAHRYLLETYLPSPAAGVSGRVKEGRDAIPVGTRPSAPSAQGSLL